MTYSWRSLTRDDTPAWSALTAAIADADDTDETYSADDLAEELEDPSIDPARDTLAVFDDDSATLVGFGQVTVPVERVDGQVRATFYGAIHPQHRGRELGSDLLARLERRTVERAEELFPGRTVQLFTDSASTDSALLLQARGFCPVRYFHVMTHDLPIAAVDADERLQSYDADRDEQVRAAHLDAFALHWNFAPPDEQRWQHWFTGSRTFRPECSTIGIGSDGAVDAYLLAYEYQAGEVWFGQIGVRPRARGRGLGAAMLNRALAAAGRTGYTTAKLDVDSENASGAGRLYDSAGFRRVRTSAVFQRTSTPT